MGPFGSKREKDGVDQAADGEWDGTLETVDGNGDRVRYVRADFDEIYMTTEAREMRRHVELGWLLVDERVGRVPGKAASWVDTAFRRSAGRVLPAQDDPEYVAPSDVTTYVLGHLKDGATGTGSDPRSAR